MKIKFLEAVVLNDRWRCGVVLSAFLFLTWVATAPSSAQVKNQKRVTSLQLTGAAQGSRVTIVSDSTLSDYEAFRRGDRFYVKIPLAYFSSSLPRFRGDGFEDVQVQKLGGSVIVSFKLQPGSTARVDQRSNRLDVTFSALGRAARKATSNGGANRATSAATVPPDNRQSPQARERGTAGPIPPASSPPYRDRVVAERTSERQGRQDGRVQTKPPDLLNKSVKNPAATSSSAADKLASKSTASPLSTSTVYPAITTAEPAPNTVANPAVSSSGSSDAPITGRAHAFSDWFSARRLTTLLVPLVLLGLVLFFLSSSNRRLTNAGKRKRGETPPVEPEYSTHVPVNEGSADIPVNLRTVAAGTRETLNESAASSSQSKPLSPGQVVSANSLRTSSIQEAAEQSGTLKEVTTASSVGTGAPENHVWMLTKPTIATIAASANPSNREDQEREVFEL